jgi:hypothetical protein
MAAALPSATFSSSSLTRWLADLSQVGVASAAVAPQTLAERLGLWLNWTDAISMSAALNAGVATPAAGGGRDQRPVSGALAAECLRLRAALAHGISLEVSRAVGAARPHASCVEPSLGEDVDFSTYRRAYLAQQGRMESAIAGLRSELRGALSGRSAGLARVAALDAALETALRAKERHLLATVPDVLQRHFERLRQAQPMQWLHRYAADMQSVLLAELDLRLQPIEGLLATLNLDLESAGRP